jgi:hypothetical protein
MGLVTTDLTITLDGVVRDGLPGWERIREQPPLAVCADDGETAVQHLA